MSTPPPISPRVGAIALTTSALLFAVMPAVGVETYTMPVIGRLYLDGVSGVAPALASIYRGPMTLAMLVGLLVLAVGAADLAQAVWRSRVLPRWGAVALAVGLALWLPLLPRALCGSWTVG
jgi:hypothetical protein